MNTYTIQSDKLNKNRVFILQKSELEKRFDPYYYLPHFKELENKLKNKNIKSVSEIASRIFSGSTPLSKGDAYTDDKNNGVPFVRSGDFTIEGAINFDDLVYLKDEIHNTQLKSSHIKENDLLFAIVGATIGKVGVYKRDRPANINQAICAVRIKKEYNIDFINAYFQTKLGQSLIDRIKRPVARANVNLDEISTLPIILPTEEIQQKVISIFNNSIAQKQKNETEADKLLSSIDDYLLKELGIKLPEPPENTLKNRMFITSIRTITNDRFDPYHHQVGFIKIIEAIRKAKYPVSNFKHYIVDLKNGVEIRNYVEEGGIRYLRVTDLGKNGLNHKSPRFVLEQEIPDRIKLNENCILISRSGSLGLLNIVEPEIENSILSSHIFKIELKTEKLIPFYLEAYLRSKVGQSEIFRNNNGGVIPEINQDALKSILIVCPPLDKQKKIAEHITGIRQQAQQLKEKTTELLKQASKEIENILLR